MDMNSNYALNINKDDVICIFRFRCNSEAASKLFDGVRFYFSGIEGEGAYNNKFVVRYFRYNGECRAVDTFYKENIHSNNFFEHNNKYIKKIERSEFYKAEKSQKIVLWEPVFTQESPDIEDTDVIYFQYFLLVLNYFRHNYAYRYSIRISAGSKGRSLIYNPITYTGAWSRLRAFLYLYSEEELSNMYIYGEYNGVKWQKLIHVDSDAQMLNFGKIFPLIEINEESYTVLTQVACGGENDEETLMIKKFRNLYKIYLNRAKEYDVEPYCDKFKNDSLLEGLIFYATLAYMPKPSVGVWADNDKLLQLHETCVDYAQGIAQLLENIVYHVNGKNGESGCGVFTFRIRGIRDASYFPNNGNCIALEGADEFKYFMELYVSDVHYQIFDGFVNKFLSNVRQRDEFQKSDWYVKLNDIVKLRHLFGEDLDKAPEVFNYYSSSQNIAMHYGLQIFNNVVISAQGSLCVSSCPYNSVDASDANYFFNDGGMGIYERKFMWENGTAYIVYLPVRYQQRETDYKDIAVSNFKCEVIGKSAFHQLDVPVTFLSRKIAGSDKENLVESIRCELHKQLCKDDTVYYIDFGEDGKKMINNLFAFEVIVKAVFMLMCPVQDVKNKINNIAFVNIPYKYDVIKLFRQFALFYNRYGENMQMKQKSVYLIDREATLDLLLYGKNLDSIKKNLAYGKIYGGYSDDAMAIINTLISKRKGKNDI